MAEPPDYVTHAAWLRLAGRVDHVDEIADQFERPAPSGALGFWTSRVERAQRGTAWFAVDRLRPAAQDRRAS